MSDDLIERLHRIGDSVGALVEDNARLCAEIAALEAGYTETELYQRGRAAGLEEAAKVADERSRHLLTDEFAREIGGAIRALAAKKEETP